MNLEILFPVYDLSYDLEVIVRKESIAPILRHHPFNQYSLPIFKIFVFPPFCLTPF